jgi:hypothetical protein
LKNIRKKILSALFAVAVIAAAVWGYFYFRNRDERMLRTMVSDLEVMVSKRPGKSNALSLLDAATPERGFAPKVKIVSDFPKMERDFTLKELSQLMVMIKKNCRSAELDLEIENIFIRDDNATIKANGMFSGNGSGGSFREVRDVTLDCQKLNGKWKISGVKLKAVIKR